MVEPVDFEEELTVVVVVTVEVCVVVVEDEAELLVCDVDVVVTEEIEYCKTLASTQSATQRLPLESNARPLG